MKTFEQLFDELVPRSGKCDTVAGEIIRAANRLIYRYYNDGDCIGIGYGNETCNPAWRYLMHTVSDQKLRVIISVMHGEYDEDKYRFCISELQDHVTRYINSNPMLCSTKNTVDMFDYQEDSDFTYLEEEEF